MRYIQERKAGSNRFWAVVMSTEFAVVLMSVGVVALLATPFIAVHSYHQREDFREACQSAGGVYVSQSQASPLCLDSKELHP